MGHITSAYIFPHPPIIIPEVGEGREMGASDTIRAANKAAEDIRNDKPTTIILTSPHAPVFQDFIYISTSNRLSGDLGRFGRSDVRMSFDNNLELVDRIVAHAKRVDILSGGVEDSIARQYKLSKDLDHGAIVPLYFVKNRHEDFKLVHIAVAGLPFIDLYRFGTCIAKAVQESDEKVVFLASGDLSHRLSEDAPYGYEEKGVEFDKLFVESVRESKIEKLLELSEDFCETAGECGLRSFLMMYGALDGFDIKPEVYSYEGPFGVGYSIARIRVGEQNPGRKILKQVEEREQKRISELRGTEDPYVELARITLETYVREERKIKVPKGSLPELLDRKAGVFVSIKKSGQLRGCIGTIEPTQKNIAEEIIQNAISSGTQDPRFDPVEPEELDKLVYRAYIPLHRYPS